MIKFINKTIKYLFSFLFIISAMTSIVAAHGMIIEPINDESVKVYYDGGGFSDRTEVVLLDKDDKELAKGNLDKDGVYKYDKSLPVVKIVAEDGLGHHAEYVVADGFKEGLPKLPIIAAAIVIFGGVAFYFNKKSKAKQNNITIK